MERDSRSWESGQGPAAILQSLSTQTPYVTSAASKAHLPDVRAAAGRGIRARCRLASTSIRDAVRLPSTSYAEESDPAQSVALPPRSRSMGGRRGRPAMRTSLHFRRVEGRLDFFYTNSPFRFDA